MASQEQRVKLIEALACDHRRLYHESAHFHSFIDFLAEGLMVQVDGAAEAAVMQQIRLAAAIKAAEAGPVEASPLGTPMTLIPPTQGPGTQTR